MIDIKECYNYKQLKSKSIFGRYFMNSKKIIASALSLAMIFGLSACKKEQEETTEVTETTQVETEIIETEAETEPEPTEDPDSLYDPSNPDSVNPITGVQDMDPDNEGMRSITVVVNNCHAAMPQRGISQADAIYEYETEGGQTRLLCVFADGNTIPEIGSLRSARIVASDLSAGMNSIFIHFGRNPRVPDHLAEYGIDDVDGNNCSAGANSSANGEVTLPSNLFFWRDSTWISQRAIEHTAVSNGDYIQAAIEHYGIDREGDSPLLFNFVPDNSEDIEEATEDCTSLNVYFSQVNDDALFEYDTSDGLYYKSQYGGEPQVDQTTGEQIAFTNVVVLYADIQPHGDSTTDAYLENGGTGWYACDGVIVPLTWTKPTPNDPITLYNEDGDELEVNRGRSYICVVDNDYTSNTSFS